ncbi:MAG: molybdenum ABC transporter ATP-binding protein [Woeseiaceae bacterium]
MNNQQLLRLRYEVERKDFALDVAAEVPLQGITGVYGASGAGKTTLLRCIAGLEQPTVGELSVAGVSLQDENSSVAVNEREIGYVFQEPRLFRHLTVRENIEYGLRRRQRDEGPTVEKVVALLGLEGLLVRRTWELSGGEAQRVAIARALLRAPRFVLMDEPLASLDMNRKMEILPFFDRLHAESSIPIIYVSHNIDEICRLCDHLLVLDQGRVVASGDLQSVLQRLDVPGLSDDEAGAVITADFTEYDAGYELSKVVFSGGELWLPGNIGTIGESLRLRIKAIDVSIIRDRPIQSSILNLIDVVIDEIQETQGPTQLLRLAVGEDNLIARITRRSREELNLQPGDNVVAQVKAAAVRGPRNGE